MARTRVAARFACDADFVLADTLARLQVAGAVHGPVESRADEVYLDTRSDELAAAGLAVRVRDHAGVTIAELVVVPIDPAELPELAPRERAIAHGEDAGEAIRAWVREMFGLELSEPPREVLSLAIVRRRWAHVTPTGSAELVVDDIAASEPHGRRARLTELVVERVEAAADGIAVVLGRSAGVTEATRTRFERARGALGLGELRYGAKPAPLSADESLVDAARRLLGQWWANACAHAAGVRVGLDPEHVHKMRVALRRLRTGMRLFDDAFDEVALSRLREVTRGLGRALGEVRDLDVQRASLDRWARRFATVSPAAWADVEQRIDRRRTHVRRAALALLEGEPWRQMAAEFERTLAAEVRGLRHTVGAVAGRLLAKRAARCARALERLDGGRAQDAHALRIEVKNLRYSLDFLADALPTELRALTEGLSRLQESLGRVQDDVQTGEFAAVLFAMAPPPAAATAHALGLLVGYGSARADLACATASVAVASHRFEDTLAELASIDREAARGPRT